MEYTHKPVMLNECVEYLKIRPNGVYVDCTLGLGNHSREIAKRLTGGKLISIDRDETAIIRAGAVLEDYKERVTLVHGNFSELGEILSGQGYEKADGILFDLGVSSPQLDEAERGFSYMSPAKIDMRMDRSAALTAADIVNGWSKEEIKRILYEYGEERYAPRIAGAIEEYRKNKQIETTDELVGIIKSAMPAHALREKQHPAKRTFQALRIVVNDELGEVSRALNVAAERLNYGGRLCIISFHSLEDRLVKNAIAARENGCTCPRDFPVCNCGFVKTLKSVTRKPLLPSKEEIDSNPRARSAKLRVAEKI